MALLHRAEMRPTKLALLSGWLPAQPWYTAGAADLRRVAAYRFDDPAGEVGIETILVRDGDGELYQVPLTYRAAPLDGGERWLVGTTAHSVLGPRWVYDGCGDPVYRTALAGALAGEVAQADECFETDGRLVVRERSMTVTRVAGPGEGDPQAGEGGPRGLDDGADGAAAAGLTRMVADTVELTLLRRPEQRPALSGDALVGAGNELPASLPLAYARPR